MTHHKEREMFPGEEFPFALNDTSQKIVLLFIENPSGWRTALYLLFAYAMRIDVWICKGAQYSFQVHNVLVYRSQKLEYTSSMKNTDLVLSFN